MIYEMKVGSFDPDRPAGDRWFANQIEGRFGQLGDAALPLDWVMLLREMDKDRQEPAQKPETTSAVSEHPSS